LDPSLLVPGQSLEQARISFDVQYATCSLPATITEEKPAMKQRNHNDNTAIPEGVALSRDLGLFTITMIGVGGMIGAGIFVLTGIAAGIAGPALRVW
jgi:amino acid permease